MPLFGHDPARERFLRLLSPWTGAAGAAPWYHALRTRYDEPQRHYHGFHHIEACLRHLDDVQDQLQEPATVELALWFHDVIYDPRAKDNEARSADFACTALQACQVEPSRVERVAQLILLTQHLAAPDGADRDAQYLLDIDLTILGAEPTLYDRYEGWVRQEYAHVPGWMFRWGRKRLLRRFLRQTRLYATDHFHDRLEAQARVNLTRAIAAL